MASKVEKRLDLQHEMGSLFDQLISGRLKSLPKITDTDTDKASDNTFSSFVSLIPGGL